MFKRNRKRRDELFSIVKRLYEEEILTYNMTLKGLPSYVNAHLNIANMLEMLKVTRAVVKYKFGTEFEKWFFETHDEIIEKFWTSKL